MSQVIETTELKERFSNHLQLKGLNSRSTKQYLYYFDLFGNPIPFTQDRVNKFILKRHNSNPIRAFINNLKEYLLTDPELDIDYLSVNKVIIPKRTGATKSHIVDVLTEEEVNAIAEVMPSERNRLMIYYNFYCGLRVQELVDIGIYDFHIDWNKLKFRIDNDMPIGFTTLKITGKRDKQRFVVVPEWLMKRTYLWLLIKGIKKHDHNTENPKIFRIGTRRWQILIKKASLKAIGKNIHPHTLRHSLGTHMLKKNKNLKVISEYLGHSDTRTTETYTHIDQEFMKKEISEIFD